MSITREEYMNHKEKEFQLLEFLRNNKDRAYEKRELLEGICKGINMTMEQLDRKLEQWKKTKIIETEGGFYIITEKFLRKDREEEKMLKYLFLKKFLKRKDLVEFCKEEFSISQDTAYRLIRKFLKNYSNKVKVKGSFLKSIE